MDQTLKGVACNNQIQRQLQTEEQQTRACLGILCRAVFELLQSTMLQPLHKRQKNTTTRQLQDAIRKQLEP